jgi:hypothetical protein
MFLGKKIKEEYRTALKKGLRDENRAPDQDEPDP